MPVINVWIPFAQGKWGRNKNAWDEKEEKKMSLKEILNHARFSQVGFVVNDIEETKKKYALLFGVTEPETK